MISFFLRAHLVLAMFAAPILSIAQQISLFNSDGDAIAYIDVEEDLTIYSWGGKPVAYLDSDHDQGFHVYGFNGNHLGWFIDGIVYDHEGDAVGFKEGAISMYTNYETYKGYQQYSPYRSYQEYAPYTPYLSNTWSNTPLSLFLARGSD